MIIKPTYIDNIYSLVYIKHSDRNISGIDMLVGYADQGSFLLYDMYMTDLINIDLVRFMCLVIKGKLK